MFREANTIDDAVKNALSRHQEGEELLVALREELRGLVAEKSASFMLKVFENEEVSEQFNLFLKSLGL